MRLDGLINSVIFEYVKMLGRNYRLTYRFSKGKKIAPAKRTAGSANEEQERIGS